MNQIEATILGQSYMLACPAGGEQMLQQAVAIVDREMSAIRDAGRVKARERIAVLTALNLAFQRVEQAQRLLSDAPVQAPPGQAALAKARPGTEADLASSTEIERLIRRIDSALGDQGQLL